MAIPTVPESIDPSESPRAASVILRAQVEDLERELRAVRKKQRRHFAWALTGVSPAALIFLVGLVLHGDYGLIIPLFLLVASSQFFLGVKATGKVAHLKKALTDLSNEECSASE